MQNEFSGVDVTTTFYSAFEERIRQPQFWCVTLIVMLTRASCRSLSAEVLEGFAAAVGIDWADRKHAICLQAASPTKRGFRVLEQKPEAIDDWANELRRRFDNRPVAVCLEQRRWPLINALSKSEHLVLYPVNPHLLAGLRRAFASSGAKDDPSDAALALDILLQHPEKLTAWVSEDACTRHLQALVEGRRRLVGARRDDAGGVLPPPRGAR